MAQKLFPIVLFVLFLGLCFLSYRYRMSHEATKLKQENKELKEQVDKAIKANITLSLKVMEKQKEFAMKFEGEKNTIKKALIIVIPDRARDIERAFAPPKTAEKKENGKDPDAGSPKG